MSTWIFFDCFNTLVDDFDPAGSENGLGSLPEQAVAFGLVGSRQDFLDAYRQACPVNSEPYSEVTFDARLESVLRLNPRFGTAERANALARLLQHWHTEYEPTLRLTPGTQAMLHHWYGRRRLAVVSNFYLAGYPRKYLERFGIAERFEFVLDSAAFGYRKPGGGIFREALRLANTQPEHVTFIGDRPDLDLYPARACGMTALHLDRRQHRPNAPETPAGYRSIQHWDDFREDVPRDGGTPP